jgi:pSer/pThr/pTyr-binding forkhead associated (FHA) protein
MLLHGLGSNMRLTVKQEESTISEFEFTEGPIYIGRHSDSQIYLGHRAVSRQHAVLFQTEQGSWMIEDLDSTNKTYLNDEAVHKAEVGTGDVIRIIDFAIEVDLGIGAETGKPINMEDTLTRTAYDMESSLTTAMPEVLVRETKGNAPDMRLVAERLKDFSQAVEATCKARSEDELLVTLLDVALRQFAANRAWCALRSQPTGPMTSHAGKARDGQVIGLNDIRLHAKITDAVEKGQYMVLPRVSAQIEELEGIRSAMVAPILRPRGCFGVIYVDNALGSDHYGLSDLDYLMLVTIHSAAMLDKI